MSRTLTLARLRTATASEALEAAILAGEESLELSTEWARCATAEVELRQHVGRILAELGAAT